MFFKITPYNQPSIMAESPTIPNLEQVTAFLEGQGIMETSYTIQMVSSPHESVVLQFPTQAYMQINAYAIQTHINNLIGTFGRDEVLDIITLTFSQEKKTG